MTQEQTRQLGIEFERRVQTINPNHEFLRKLDTDTIYSFLNEYQTIWFEDHLNAMSNPNLTSVQIAKITAAIAPFLKSVVINRQNTASPITNVNARTFTLPADFLRYVRSNSLVDMTYNMHPEQAQQKVVPNNFTTELMSQVVQGATHDSGRIIRNPIAFLRDGQLVVIHDSYTSVNQVQLFYYRAPKFFNLIGYTFPTTSNTCELPMSAFDEIVRGAVDLYITQYENKLSIRPAPTNDEQPEAVNEQ